MSRLTLHLADERAMEAFGARLARHAVAPLVIFLRGDLGAGKTTLVRGFLRGCGHRDAVRSPTYTLVEPYQLAGGNYYHFDLYRLGDPEELEFLGIRDYLDGSGVALFEWPERGEGILPPADLVIAIRYRVDGRDLEVSAYSPPGEALLGKLTE